MSQGRCSGAVDDVRKVITGDVSWVYGYYIDTKDQPSQGKCPEKERPEKARQVR